MHDDFATFYAGAVDSPWVAYFGGDYILNPELGFSLYTSRLKDAWDQTYVGISGELPRSERISLFGGINYYDARDEGKKLLGEFSNQIWSARVGIAVCTVVVFGTLSMLTYPILYRLGMFDLSLEQMGFLMGASLHEVAHAVGAGSALGGEAADITVIMKMLRVLMLVPFLLMLGFGVAYFRKAKVQQQHSLRQNIPYFALWFLAMVLLSSLIDQQLRVQVLPYLIQLDNFLLCMAMGALGMSMKKAIFTNAGFKPFVLASALLVWLVGFAHLMVAYVWPAVA